MAEPTDPNPTPTPNPNPEPQDGKDIGERIENAFKKGLREGRERGSSELIGGLKGIGVNIVDNDLVKSIQTHIETLNKATGLEKQQQEVYQKNIAEKEAQIADLSTKLTTAERNYELRLAIKKFDVTDEDDFFQIFNARYELQDNNGVTRVVDRTTGYPLMDEKTGDTLNVQGAMRKLLDAKPHLEKATSRPNNDGTVFRGQPKDLTEKYKKMAAANPNDPELPKLLKQIQGLPA